MFRLVTGFILIISSVFANPQMTEAYDTIDQVDQKLENFHKSMEQLVEYFNESSEECKDLLMEEDRWFETIQQNQKLKEKLGTMQKAFLAFLDEASSCVALAQGGDHVNQSLCYSAHYAEAVDWYINLMKQRLFPQGWWCEDTDNTAQSGKKTED